MTNTITPIKRAVIVLDQSSGELRTDSDELLGLDLWHTTRSALSVTRTKGLETILVVPSEHNAANVTDLSGWMEGLKVAPISPKLVFGADGSNLAGLTAGDPATALVTADRKLRGEAARSGLQPAPHVALLPMMMRGEAPVAVRMVAQKDVLGRLALQGDVIPMHFQPTRNGDWALIALVGSQVPVSAVMKRIELSVLPYDPMMEDLVWVRIDADTSETRNALAGRQIVYAEPGQALVALLPDEDTQALHLHGAHGHTELLQPAPDLLKPVVRDSLSYDAFEANALPEGILEAIPRATIDPIILRVLRPNCASVTANYLNDLDRYTGISPLDANGPVVSRHSAHSDNKRAEAQLLADLQAIGYCAYRHDFVHAGQTHSNIIADLPGRGLLRIKPEILDRYRRVLLSNPLPKPLGPFAEEMHELAEADWFKSPDMKRMTDVELRYRIEGLFRLRPWYPWWKKICEIAGFGADLVIVGCHLDSTAGFDPGYSAATDPAPGRDDNASGLAGVLTLARHLWSMRGTLTHTVRFCFFNAEESGLVGSKFYAAKLKALNAPIRAVICMDMIGYNSDPNRIFEVHAGFTDPAVRDLSLPLASQVENAAAAYGQLAPAQVYAGTSWNGAPDRNVFDGAINRSDHAAFHQQGYPAILVSEDFFANLATEPNADSNPNYHRAADSFVDLHYARDIVCAVSQAVIELAR
jgi:hypothetical protein